MSRALTLIVPETDVRTYPEWTPCEAFRFAPVRTARHGLSSRASNQPRIVSAIGVRAAAISCSPDRPASTRRCRAVIAAGRGRSPVQVEQSATPEPFYDDGQITIYNGDCREILPTLERADLVLTDPPYNAGKNYGAWHDDAMKPEAYEIWCAEWFQLARDVADRMVVFPGHGNVGMWYRINKPAGMGCWHKSGNPAGGGVIQFCEWEPWLLWGKGIGGSDVVRATITEQFDTGNHPCPKPIKLFRALIHQSKASTVIDPFVGSGTTLRAAKDLGVRAIGIELNPAYCQIAVERLAQDVFDFGGSDRAA